MTADGVGGVAPAVPEVIAAAYHTREPVGVRPVLDFVLKTVGRAPCAAERIAVAVSENVVGRVRAVGGVAERGAGAGAFGYDGGRQQWECAVQLSGNVHDGRRLDISRCGEQQSVKRRLECAAERGGLGGIQPDAESGVAECKQCLLTTVEHGTA